MDRTAAAENKKLVRAYYAAWDTGDPEAIATFFADGFSTSYTDWTGEEHRVEPAEVDDWIAGWLDIMAEMTHEIHDLVAAGDQVIAHVTYRGVHEGRIHGIEPSGTGVEGEEYVKFRIEGDRIVELDWLEDTLALLRQLGVDLPIEG